MAWLTGWNRRKQIYINGSSAGNQSYYQMIITVNYGSGTDNTPPGNIYCSGNVKNDFSDIRFTDIDGSTQLNYWIETYTSSSRAMVWIQIPSIPTGSNSTYIYLYYNNPSATTASNGTNTFVLFDDFSTNTWSGYNTSYLSISGNKVNFNHTMTGDINAYLYKSFTKNSDLVVYYSFKINAGQYRGGASVGFGNTAARLETAETVSPQTSAVYPWTTQDVWIRPKFFNPSYTEASGIPILSQVQYWLKNVYYGSTLKSYAYTDNLRSSLVSTYPYSVSGAPTTNLNYLIISNTGDANNNWPGDNSFISSLFITKYASPEPSWSTINTEQQTATLNISSTPIGAEIYLASPSGTTYVDKGVQTNSTLYVGPGNYDLKLTKGGYLDWTLTNQNWSSGQTYNIPATLTQIPGSLSISSTPSGAEIYLALQPGSPTDQLIQTTPSGTNIPNLTPGTYNILLKLTGYQDWTGTSTVTSNIIQSVSATFAGSAYITSIPTGAEIYLAVSPGNPLDQGIQTPSTITNLTPTTSGATNIWNYLLKLTGYADTSGTFTATAGSTVNVPVTFPGSLYITSIPTGASIYIDGILQ